MNESYLLKFLLWVNNSMYERKLVSAMKGAKKIRCIDDIKIEQVINVNPPKSKKRAERNTGRIPIASDFKLIESDIRMLATIGLFQQIK